MDSVEPVARHGANPGTHAAEMEVLYILGQIAFWIVTVVLLIAAAVLPYFCLQQQMMRYQVRAAIAREPDPGGWVAGVDKQINEASMDGDVAVQFYGLSPENTGDMGSAINFITRGTYAIAPRRLRTVPEGTTVLVTDTVLKAEFHPTVRWLQQRNVRSIFTYVKADEGLQVYLERVTPSPLLNKPYKRPPILIPPPTGASASVVIWVMIYALVIVLVGCAITSIVLGGATDDRRSIAEIVGLVLMLGCGGVAMLLIWISMCGIAPGRTVVVLLGLASTVILALRGRRGRLPIPRLPERPARPWVLNLLLVPPAIVLLGVCLFTLVSSVGLPITNWDSFVIWGMKAKILASLPLTPRPAYFSDVSISFTHLDYPLLISMLLGGAYAAMRQFNEGLGKIVLPMLFTGHILVFYSGARMWLGRVGAALVTVVLFASPVIVMFSPMCSGEMPLCAFRLGSVLYMVRWIDRRQRADAILSALFTVFAANTKNEGLAVALITLLVMATFAFLTFRKHPLRLAWRDIFIFVLILAVGAGIWTAWRSGLPHTDENYPDRLTVSILSQNINRLGAIFTGFRYCMGAFTLWGGFWVVVPIVAALGFRAFARPQTQALWAMLLLHLGLYVLIYIITSWDVQALMGASLQRLLQHLSQTAALLLAAHWASLPWPGRAALPAERGFEVMNVLPVPPLE